MKDINKNEIYECVCEGYTSEALGVCRISDRAVFVAGALCGEKLSVRITKVSNSAVYGRIEGVLSPSASRAEPYCPFYKQCGGCSTLHMDYTEELNFKLDKVNNALLRIGKQSVKADSIIPSSARCGYRNKITFQVSQNDGAAYFGYYSLRSHNVVPIQNCGAADPRAVLVAQAVIDFINLNNIAAYDEQTEKGSVRHIYIRRAVKTEDFCLCISSAEGFGKKTSSLVAYIRRMCPYVTGIVLNINRYPGNELLRGDFHTLYGEADIVDFLKDFKYRISPKSFYQINPEQTEKLYSLAVDFAGSGSGTCLELYCGIGTISLFLSKKFEKVIGVEIVPDAIENAKYNAFQNGVTNIRYICADAGNALLLLEAEHIRPDTVVVDPPRKGMTTDAIEAVCRMAPEKIVYISCNPSTLARDVVSFNEYGYKLIKVKAVDMFPGTFHVETVVLLVRIF